MIKLFHSRSLYIFLALGAIVIVVAMMLGVGKRNVTPPVTAAVEKGSVRQLVSVSGVAEAEQSAELAFPVTGIVATVPIKEGALVEEGNILVTLDTRALQADRQDALALLNKSIADRDELLAGPSSEARDATSETVALKTAALASTKETEARKIENAKRTLLSSGLTAYSDKVDEDATPPTISGTYNCDTEGKYTLDVFATGAQSGFSYRLSGIETGTFVGSTDQPIALGSCGLRIQFDTNSNYVNTDWNIDIPNTKSTLYTTNKNAYELARTQADSAIAIAEQELVLAQANATNSNAPARTEAIARANASIAQAQARLARIDAEIEDRILRAPFSGTVTEIDILPGETVTNTPIVTLLAESDFKVTARIPEIDIGKLLVGQVAEMVFDARSTETIFGTIEFISLKATEIDGVAYYEAVISLDEIPSWIRSGLNADIDIVVDELHDVLRVPTRFVSTATEPTVLVPTGDMSRPRFKTASTTVEILLNGNDGFVAITGLNEGDVVVAP